jgi:glyoxylase I family protein
MGQELNATELKSVRDARWDRNRVRRLHHHAVRTDDMEATRRFYEDILGLPMVIAMKESFERIGGKPVPFLHCFFELGDGSFLAFFQFPPEAFGPADKLPKQAIDHHIAVAVAEFSDIEEVKASLESHGHPCCGINHGFCYSLYVRDPNGMMLEFVCDAPGALAIYERAARKAHETLLSWRMGEVAADPTDRVRFEFPMPTSPGEDIAKIMGLG